VSSQSDVEATEEEVVPIVVTVSPNQQTAACDSVQQSAAVVPPFHYSPTSTSVSSSSRAQEDSHTRSLQKRIVEPTPRRSLRSKAKESLSISTNNRENSPKPDLSSTSLMDLQSVESPASSDNEIISPVRRVHPDVNLPLTFPQSKRKDESVPLPSDEPVSNDSKNSEDESKVNDDRERNIDAFNCERSNYELSLKVRKPRKMCSRLPFYIPSHKMDVHSFIAYFKKCVTERNAKILEFQKRSHKCIPWGDPVVVKPKSYASLEENNSGAESSSYAGVDQKNGVTSMQRRNLRNRRVLRSNRNNINIEEEEVEDNNDAFFDSLLDNKCSDDVEIKKKETVENTKTKCDWKMLWNVGEVDMMNREDSNDLFDSLLKQKSDDIEIIKKDETKNSE
ncbi:hypothetical protein L9F63_008109, partial [Diploptera punctata]